MKKPMTLFAAAWLLVAVWAQPPSQTPNPGSETPSAKSSEAAAASLPPPQYPALPSEPPAAFGPVTDSFDYVNHVFQLGHRLMVQVQSSWFPLYDRNPQTFVTNIFWAQPEDYRKALQRLYHTPGQASFIELPLVSP